MDIPNIHVGVQLDILVVSDWPCNRETSQKTFLLAKPVIVTFRVKSVLMRPSSIANFTQLQYNISRVEDGRQKPMRKGGCKTKKEAMEAALQVELDLVNGFLNPTKNYPFKKYFKSWYETLRFV